MTLLAIDPGLRGVGLAKFSDGLLYWAGYIRNPDKKGRGPAAWDAMLREAANFVDDVATAGLVELAVELPRVYPKMKTDPNDLIDLAGVLGCLVANCYSQKPAGYKFNPVKITTYAPSDWKGQVPKDIMNARVWAKLSDDEKSSVQRVGAKDHNTLDAIGIGLKALGRL